MNACALYPIVDGKPSTLYKELLEATKNNRPLTNLLYALSLQDKVKSMFASSELNAQGEPKIKEYIEKMNVQSIIDDNAQIAIEAISAGLYDNNGNPIYDDDPRTFLQKVYDFNESHDTMKAAIKYSEYGYYVEVDTLNANNFNSSNRLKFRDALNNVLMQRLEEFGYNTDFSPEVAKSFNFITVNQTLQTIESFKSIHNLGEAACTLMMELFADSPHIERLYDEFGSDLPKALSQVSGWRYGRESMEINPYQETQIHEFFLSVQNKVNSTFTTQIMRELRDKANSDTTASETYMGTQGLEVQHVLNDLYKTYALDQDSMDALQKKMKTLSDAAKKLFQIRLARFDEAALKTGGENKTIKSELIKAQKQMNDEKYIESVIAMLEDTQKEIKFIDARITALQRDLDANPNSLTAISAYAEFVMKQIDLVNAFKPILEELQSAKLLENDDTDSNMAPLVDNIQDMAKDMTSILTEINNICRKKQVEVVTAFLRIYWGEDTAEARAARGSDTTLDQIMQTASHDIGFFDRFLYSVNACSDEMLGIVAQAVKKQKEKRDKALIPELREIQSITKELYDAGYDTKCMFELDKDGYPSRIKSDYNFDKFEEDLAAYEKSLRDNPSVKRWEIPDKVAKWKDARTVTKRVFGIQISVPRKIVNGVDIYAAEKTVKERLTPAEYKYYEAMMKKKASMLAKIPAANNNDLFKCIEISTDVTTAFKESGGDITKVAKIVKNKVVDLFKVREDDTEYGNASILEGNGIVQTHVDAQGHPIMTLPLFYTHKIKDRSRVSTDFSRSMMAYMAASTEYIEMDKIIDALMLTKDYMMSRNVAQTQGSSTMASVSKFGKQLYVNVASKAGINTSIGGLTEDFYERNIYGRSKKNEGYVWGTKITWDKFADSITGYTSVTGLAVNALGAQANVLVGKLQMLIETGLGFGGEFFNMKDMAFADAKYFHMLMPLLNECMSTTKSSPLALLMERFDVSDDFYEKIKESGFYKEPISKIIGNTSLFMLYGLGEHLLHAQGMLAVLHNKKNTVLDDKGKERTLFEAFEVEKDANGAGTLKIKEGWTTKEGNPIDDEFIDKVKGKISYVNKSMHGAFGKDDKGMIHRYAIGRMIMNFRQWMPAHYSRRFRGRHWDGDLNQYREGYYVSAFKFVKQLSQDAVKMRFQFRTRYKQLKPDQRENLKRAYAETMIFAMLAAACALAGDPKDHKGNWARRHLIYQLKRMQLETAASTPIAMYGFISNGLKILNSPMACLNTIEKISNLVNFTDLFCTIESGKHKDENKYLVNAEKNLPFIGQIMKMLNMGEDSDLFQLFN